MTAGAQEVSVAPQPVVAEVPFSLGRLLLLVGWVYLCMYFIMRVQFSNSVPKRQKPIINTFTLIGGPIPLIVVTILNISKQIAAGQQTIFEVLKKRIQNLRGSIKLSGLISFRDHYTIKLLDSSGRSITDIYGHGKRSRRSAGVLNLTEQIIWGALEELSSDILIDPKDETIYSVRFRIDGVLYEVENIEAETCKAVINSIKAVSNMDIAEKRRPQDGAFIAKTAKGTTSFRVASAGALNGEKLSIRVLRQDVGIFTLDNVGLSAEQRAIIEEAVNKPSGMVLMCGPTGSGKTSTLFAMLNRIDLFTRNVITVEDPIEYVLPNASQIEVNPKAGITFASSLRSILRQDPDVICIGEIRDEETAAIALRAAQTGHLVVATVHCSSPASALVRLTDLGVSPLLLSSGLSLLVSQRLVRQLCNVCKVRAKLKQKQIDKLQKSDIDINYDKLFSAVGCEQCRHTGYKGRMGIFDILPMDDTLKSGIANESLSMALLRKEGDARGKYKLQKNGLEKVAAGLTSMEELNRVIG